MEFFIHLLRGAIVSMTRCTGAGIGTGLSCSAMQDGCNTAVDVVTRARRVGLLYVRMGESGLQMNA